MEWRRCMVGLMGVSILMMDVDAAEGASVDAAVAAPGGAGDEAEERYEPSTRMALAGASSNTTEEWSWRRTDSGGGTMGEITSLSFRL